MAGYVSDVDSDDCTQPLVVESGSCGAETMIGDRKQHVEPWPGSVTARLPHHSPPPVPQQPRHGPAAESIPHATFTFLPHAPDPAVAPQPLAFAVCPGRLVACCGGCRLRCIPRRTHRCGRPGRRPRLHRPGTTACRSRYAMRGACTVTSQSILPPRVVEWSGRQDGCAEPPPPRSIHDRHLAPQSTRRVLDGR